MHSLFLYYNTTKHCYVLQQTISTVMFRFFSVTSAYVVVAAVDDSNHNDVVNIDDDKEDYGNEGGDKDGDMVYHMTYGWIPNE